MLKKCFLLGLLFCGILTTAFSQVKISGKIKGYEGQLITLNSHIGRNIVADTVTIAKNGKFYYENKDNIPAFIMIADRQLFLAMSSEDHLEMSIDLRKYPTLLVEYRGDHAAENAFQYEFAQLQELQTSLLSDGYIPFADFYAQIKNSLAKIEVCAHNLTDETIKARWKEQRRSLPAMVVFGYYDMLKKTDSEKVFADKDFESFVDSVDLNDKETANFNTIYPVLSYYLDKEKLKRGLERELRYLDLVMQHITNVEVRNAHLTEYMAWRLKGERVKYMPEIFEKYASLCTDKAAVDSLRENFEVYMNHFKIRNGITAPDFEMVDKEGNRMRLSDFRGKMVYIDVWATWCAPCCAEIPHVGKLREHFVNDPRIEFISISVDTQVKKWQKMVEEEQLPWKQFIVDGGTDSDFYKSYAIEFIPRFMLIGKDGTIVEIDYMKPSTPGCAENLKAILDNQ